MACWLWVLLVTTTIAAKVGKAKPKASLAPKNLIFPFDRSNAGSAETLGPETLFATAAQACQRKEFMEVSKNAPFFKISPRFHIFLSKWSRFSSSFSCSLLGYHNHSFSSSLTLSAIISSDASRACTPP